MPVAALREEVERFISGCQEPVLIEPGEAPFALAGPHAYRLSERSGRFTIEAWDETRTLCRHMVDIRSRQAARLTVEIVKFGGKPGTVTLADRARAQSAPALLRGARQELQARLRTWLARQYSGWSVREITCGADLEHSLSPVYPRALLARSNRTMVALAAPPQSADAALTFALIWHAYARRRDGQSPERLALFVAAGEENNTLLRLTHLRLDADLFVYDGERERLLDRADHGNLATRVEPWIEPPPSDCGGQPRRWAHELSLLAGVETVQPAPGELSLRVRGLEFARYGGGQLRFGVDRRATARNCAEVERLAAALADARSADSDDRDHPWRRRNPEAWLESQVRANITLLDANLLESPIYGQVPAIGGGDRGVIDLLAADRFGRLSVIELKASEDPQLPLQALDYWIRVAHHASQGDFSTQGYFRTLTLTRDRPRLLLVAPSLEFHPTTETILGYFTSDVEVERIGLGVEWQRVPRVVLRACGAQRPEWDHRD